MAFTLSSGINCLPYTCAEHTRKHERESLFSLGNGFDGLKAIIQLLLLQQRQKTLDLRYLTYYVTI
jgi:hypothetical protein